MQMNRFGSGETVHMGRPQYFWILSSKLNYSLLILSLPSPLFQGGHPYVNAGMPPWAGKKGRSDLRHGKRMGLRKLTCRCGK